MNRREFLKAGGLGMLTMLAGGYGMSEAKPKNSTVMETESTRLPEGRKVDFHCHAILPSYINGLKRLGIDSALEEGFPLPSWSLEHHIAFMSKANIDYSVLSMPTPHIYHGDASAAAQVAREINTEMAGICEAHPKQFGFAASLPLPDEAGSLEEIRYSMDKLGALGVKVASNSCGVYLGDPCLDNIFAELNRRKALVILHPSPAQELPRGNVVTGNVMALFEYPTDTTRAVLNLLANGTLEKFPDIRLVVPHTGSFLPYMKTRAAAMFAMLAKLGMMKTVDVEKGISKLYFDLAGDPIPDELEMLMNITDDTHIVYGSDYPYVLEPILLQKKKALDDVLISRRWAGQVYVNNAETLLQGQIWKR